MSQSERIEIPLSRLKLVKLLVFGLLFVAAGYYLFSADPAWIEQQRRFNNPTFVHAIGLAGLLMGVLGSAAVFAKAFSKRPGLVIDGNGITDMSSLTAHGYIPWTEIRGFSERIVGGQRLVFVLLRDPDQFISGFGPLRRFLLRANTRLGPSPVALSNVALTISFEGLLSLLESQQVKSGVVV
jgi:hypothetical protein